MSTTEAFGYTYPETSKLGQDNGRRGNIVAQINRLYGDGPAAAGKTVAASTTSRHEWFVEVQVERADLQLPCSIDVYLGDRLASRTMLLSMPKTGLAHDELSISRAVNRLDVNGDDSAAVERALLKELHAKVVKVR